MEYSKLKLLSLFDGSGGFPLAGSLYGIEPVSASEVEPYPIAVTRSRLPNMKHLGNICNINGAEIEPVDIVSFGSPCQDLSVAGLRKGLKHEDNGDEETTRSGLFMEAIRIIKEMREATNGRYPTFAVWENVPGAFSSNKGEDFRVVLEELIKIAEPTAVMPSVPQKGWAYADYYCGDGWSLAYRVLDAQYWGVPQRRRRIFLVADFGGERAREILFERESLRGCFAEGRTPWKDYGGCAAECVGTADCQNDSVIFILDRAFYNQGQNALYEPQYYTDGVAPTVVAKGPGAVVYAMQAFGAYKESEVASALKQRDYKDATDIVCQRCDDPEWIARRWTTTECARLQGFPDRWGHPDHKDDFTDEEYRFWLDVRNTHAEINGKAVKDYTKEQMVKWYNKLHTDSAEYKMYGNGVALPCVVYVMEGIVGALKGGAE